MSDQQASSGNAASGDKPKVPFFGGGVLGPPIGPQSSEGSAASGELSQRRERLRRAVEDGERLYRVRMHAPEGPTIADDNRIDGILTLDLVDALGLVDQLIRRLLSAHAAKRRPWWLWLYWRATRGIL